MEKLTVLQNNLSKLSQRDQSFAQSLLNQSSVRQLSDKQMYWVGVLADRATEVIQMADVASELQVKEVFELLQRNNAAKRPKLRVLIGTDELQLSRAGSSARFPGSLNVVQLQGRVWLGRVHLDGKFEPARYVEASRALEISAALKQFAANPEETARAYGKQTGHCCFCSKHLEDERSLVMGYGPVCAANWKLPWGERKAA